MSIALYLNNGTVRLYARKRDKRACRANGARTVYRPTVTHEEHKEHKPNVVARVLGVVRRIFSRKVV